MLEFPNPDEKLREQEYCLRCKVVIKEVTYEDFQSKGVLGNVTEKMAFLIPQEGTQRDMFFSAWLPDYEQDSKGNVVPTHTEIACKTGHPVYGFFRASVHRPDERMSEPYIFVMSRSVEEDLKALDGKFVIIDVLGDSEIEKADYAKDYELANRTND
jgi:hypothetical protein